MRKCCGFILSQFAALREVHWTAGIKQRKDAGVRCEKLAKSGIQSFFVDQCRPLCIVVPQATRNMRSQRQSVY